MIAAGPSIRATICWLALLAGLACGSDATGVQPPVGVGPDTTDTTGLRTYAARRNFLIGSAIDRGFRYPGADGVTFRTTIAHEFNVLTSENDMKFDHLHSSRDVYRFASADSLVAFAESNGMKVRGHNLLWHQQLPSWLTSGTWTKAQAESLLADHVTTVVSHYRGHVMEWDVVNEPFNDDGTMRAGFWMDHIRRATSSPRSRQRTPPIPARSSTPSTITSKGKVWPIRSSAGVRRIHPIAAAR